MHKRKNVLMLMSALVVGAAGAAVEYLTPQTGDVWTSRAVCSSETIAATARTSAVGVKLQTFDSRFYTEVVSGFLYPFYSDSAGFLLYIR